MQIKIAHERARRATATGRKARGKDALNPSMVTLCPCIGQEEKMTVVIRATTSFSLPTI